MQNKLSQLTKMSGAQQPILCKASLLSLGEKKEVVVDCGEKKPLKLLLVRTGQKEFQAVSAKCAHYGAPLINGTISTNFQSVRCPWHGACFNLKTGDIEDFPCVDHIQSYPVKLSDDGQHVCLETTNVETNFRRAPTLKQTTKLVGEKKTIVVVGGGAAGLSCVQSLRENGFVGHLHLIGAESLLPYDRPKLSKQLPIRSTRSILLRDEKFFSAMNVDVHLNSEVVMLDSKAQMVIIDSSNSSSSSNTSLSSSSSSLSKNKIHYDFAFVATGGIARRLRVDGHQLKNIFTLRTFQDAQTFSNQVYAGIANKRSTKPSRNIVIIGSSFIGMECAAILSKKLSHGSHIHVVGMESVPFERVLGKPVGQLLAKMHVECSKGMIQLHMGTILSHYTESRVNPGHVGAVVLKNGITLQADMVVLGCGIIPATNFIDGVKKHRDHSVIVDDTMKACKGLYCGGDMARFPFTHPSTKETHLVRVEHWGLAQEHGKIAALNMLAEITNTPTIRSKAVPFFWTSQFSKSLRYVGHSMDHDEIVVWQSTADRVKNTKLAVYYLKKGIVQAAASLNADPICAAITDLFVSSSQHPITEKIVNHYLAQHEHIEMEKLFEQRNVIQLASSKL